MAVEQSDLAGPWEAYGSSTYVGVRTVNGGKKIAQVPLGPCDSDIADLIAAAPNFRRLVRDFLAIQCGEYCERSVSQLADDARSALAT